MAVNEVSLDEKVQRCNNLVSPLREILEVSRRMWEKNRGNGLFTDVRNALLHLRREGESLDKVEDKPVFWHFLLLFSRGCQPALKSRMSEILLILLRQEEWMRHWAGDPLCCIPALPEDLQEAYAKGLDAFGIAASTEMHPTYEELEVAKFSLANQAKMLANHTVDISVQRVVQAKLLKALPADTKRVKKEAPIEETDCGSIGAGLVVEVFMGKGTTQQNIEAAAEYVLTEKLSTSAEPGEQRCPVPIFPVSDAHAASIVDLCARGKKRGILVVLRRDPEEDGRVQLFYKKLVQVLKGRSDNLIKATQESAKPNVVYAPFGVTTYLKAESEGEVCARMRKF